MNLINLIKKRTTVRNFLRKDVSKKKLFRIVEAGIWGPSLAGKQIFRFIIIKNSNIKKKLYFLVQKKLKSLGISGRVMFIPSTLRALTTCNVLIAVYSTGEFQNLISRFSKYITTSKNNNYVKLAEQAEISAVSGAIQNMILQIENLGLGSCWLHIPLYCENQVNKLLIGNNKHKLICILAIGYSDVKEKRTKRRTRREVIKYLN